MMNKIIELKNIVKKFGDKTILNNLDIEIYKNEMVCIMGKSGSGKTTLLNIIGFLEPFNSGTYSFNNQKNIAALSSNARKLYKHKIGFLFQDFALIDNETVFHNLGLVLKEKKKGKRRQIVLDVLSKLNIDYLIDSIVNECSGGECQRIAIARLLLQDTQVILADEPTGSLDNKTKLEIFDLLRMLKKEGKTIVIVTHDEDLKEICDRYVILKMYNEEV